MFCWLLLPFGKDNKNFVVVVDVVVHVVAATFVVVDRKVPFR
jgi:hypothetical protein